MHCTVGMFFFWNLRGNFGPPVCGACWRWHLTLM